MPEGYDGSIHPVAVTANVLTYRHSFERLFRSGDAGANWAGDPSRDPSFLVLHEGMIYADDGGDILQSADASAWSFFAETPFFALEDAAFRGDDIAVASYAGVVVSPDGGQTWTDVSTGLSGDGHVDAVTLAPDGYVYAAVGYQVQKSLNPLEGTGTSAGKQVPEVVSALLEPYPNFADGRTRLSFVLARSERVELSVYDELGKRVAVLLEQQVPPGRQEVDWRPRGLANGTYFIRMTVPGGSWTRAVTVSR